MHANTPTAASIATMRQAVRRVTITVIRTPTMLRPAASRTAESRDPRPANAMFVRNATAEVGGASDWTGFRASDPSQTHGTAPTCPVAAVAHHTIGSHVC